MPTGMRGTPPGNSLAPSDQGLARGGDGLWDDKTPCPGGIAGKAAGLRVTVSAEARQPVVLDSGMQGQQDFRVTGHLAH